MAARRSSPPETTSTVKPRLQELLEELATAGDDARLQLHLLALEARQRTGEFGTRLDNLERTIDRGLHQALSTAADGARQLTKTLHASLGLPPSSSSSKSSGQVRIGSVMSEPVQVCSAEDSLERPAQIMWDTDCGAVPVLDSEGRLCGVVTDRDICMGAYTKGVALQQIRVAEVMSRHVRTCAPEDTLERAIGIMAAARVRRLPVVSEDQRLRGMISLADIVHSAALLGRREAEALVFGLVGALSERRRSGSEQFAAE
jgi:CBS domain-containing protein